MPHYTLTVTRSDPNPDYDAAQARNAADQRARGYGSVYYNVPATVETQVVLIALTEEQFNAVRRAVLEVAK